MIEKFKKAPNGSIVFVFGAGIAKFSVKNIFGWILTNAIKIFQKIESEDFVFDYTTPSHAESKISETETVSAEAIGVKRCRFKRYEKKNVGLAIAKPVIETDSDRVWQERAIKMLNLSVGAKPYDYKGLLMFVYRVVSKYTKLPNINTADWEWAEFCSELAATPYQDIKGGDKFLHISEPSHKVSPEELIMDCVHSDNMEIEVLRDLGNGQIKRYIEKLNALYKGV